MMVVGAGHLGAHDDGVADAAAADDGDGLAGADVGGVEGGADAGADTAADQTEGFGVEIGVNGDALVGVDEGVGAEGADAEDGGEFDAVVAVHLAVGVETGGAEVGLTDEAEAAVAAGGAPGEDDEVAFLDISDIRADVLDDAAALVTEEEGEDVRAEDAVLGGEVGVADAAGEDADQGVVGAEGVDLELFDLTGFAGFPRDDAARRESVCHVVTPS